MAKKRVFSGANFTHYKKCETCERKATCNEENVPGTAYSILLDCEGFYYVFCRLEEIEKYPLFTGDVAKHQSDVEEYEQRLQCLPSLMPQMLTNGALALELALKYLIFKENKEFECSHDLSVLFTQLPQRYGDELRAKIYPQIHQDEETLKRNLNIISNIFVDARYWFEHDTCGYSNFFTDLVHLVCDYVIEQNNDHLQNEE